MKKLTILLLTILILILSNCKNNSEPPKDLLKYTIVSENISDTPLKTQVSINILLTDIKNINEKKLETLLTYLYNQQINRTGFKYHKHLNTVLVYAFSTKEKANAGKGQWVAMISKMYDDTNPKFEISETQFKALTVKEQDKWGLTQKKRQEIWDKIIYAERNAQKEADKKHPLDKPGITQEDMKKNIKLMEKIKVENQNGIAQEYQIEISIIDSIGFEGVMNGWSFPK